MMEYQLWACDRKGELLHAGVQKIDRETRIHGGFIRKYVQDWERWADTIAAKWPGCGTAGARRRTFRVFIHPVGWENRPYLREFDARGREIEQGV